MAFMRHIGWINAIKSTDIRQINATDWCLCGCCMPLEKESTAEVKSANAHITFLPNALNRIRFE